MPEPIIKRRFELKSDRSYKFWSVEIKNGTLTINHGRIGNRGQIREKLFSTEEEAKVYLDKEVRKKIKAGYREVIHQPPKLKSNAQLWEELEPHEPFLQAILEAPDGIENFMVYADWLMEQNDPRGQFILSCLAAEDPQTPMREQTKHFKLSSEIQIANWRDWIGELSPFFEKRGYSISYHRGLIASLQLESLGPSLASALKNSPHCRMLRGLQIASTQLNTTTINLDGIQYEADKNYGLQPLFEADFGNLRSFKFSSRQTNANQPHYSFPRRRQTGIPVFEFIRQMPRLESLSLDTLFDESDYRFLFDSELPNLSELELKDRFSNQPIEALCRSNWMEQLRSLKLYCELDVEICELLADSLDPNLMDQIVVFHNRIPEEGLNTIEKTGVTVATI